MVMLHAQNSFSKIENLHIYGNPYAAGSFFISSGQEALSNITFKRLLLENRISMGELLKWGMRLYNFRYGILQGVKIYGINKEHPLYFNLEGGVEIQGCHLADAGAQGVQIAWRSIETNNPTGWSITGIQRLNRTVIEKCGQPRGYGRASFAASFFGKQNNPTTDSNGVVKNGPRTRWDCPVELLDTRIVHDSLGQYELRGALLCEHRPSIRILGGEINYNGLADRDLCHIYKTDEVLIDACRIEGQRFVDITGAQTVRITNCTGNARVRINGVVVGKVSEGYTTDDALSIVGPGPGLEDAGEYASMRADSGTCSTFQCRKTEESVSDYADRVAFGDDGEVAEAA